MAGKKRKIPRDIRIMVRLNAEEGGILQELAVLEDVPVSVALRRCLKESTIKSCLSAKEWDVIRERAIEKGVTTTEIIAQCVAFCVKEAAQN